MRKSIGLLLIAGSVSCLASAQNSSGMPAGNIGIGTTTPATYLQVHNPNTPGGTIGNTSEIATFSGSSPHYAQFEFLLRRQAVPNIWESMGGRLQFTTDVTNQGYIEFNPNGDPNGLAFGSNQGEILRLSVTGHVHTTSSLYIHGGDLVLKRTTHPFGYVARPNVAGFKKLQFAVEGGGPLEDLHLNSIYSYFTGIVGIGMNPSQITIPDPSTKLFVDGGVRARKIKVDHTTWADFVFDDGYPLPSLTEVEKYIQQHKHLIGVPSQQEVRENGIDLGNNQALLLQKIEELTLYLIEQNKKILLLQQELDALKYNAVSKN